MDVITLLLIWTAAMLAIGTITDFRWREVPDWLNFAAIAAGLGTRAIASLAIGDWSYLITGALGFGIALVIAYAMFYLGQWGGGDSKMLLAIGALLGFEPAFDTLGVGFFINALVVGAAYGIIWSIALAILNRQRFSRSIGVLWKDPSTRLITRAAMIVGIALFCIAWFLPMPLQLTVLLFGASVPGIAVLGIIIKAVETGCMLRRVTPDKLTEGDWIVHDVRIGGKRITGPKDLGISIPQINILMRAAERGKIKTVLIKDGIPFVPSFALSFLVTIVWGNLALFLI